jgi:hypothetical protein
MDPDTPRPRLAATMMASVPFRDMEQTLGLIRESCPEAPRLPVMTRSFRWTFEGLPCLHLDREKKQVLMLPPEEREDEVLAFYEAVEAEDLDYFATSEAAASFYYQMVAELKKDPPPEMRWLGFQFPGPMVLGDSYKQTNGMPAFQHETLWDILVKAVAMKTRWMEHWLSQEFPGVAIIADHPEPTLVSFTSAQGTGSRESVIATVDDGFAGFGGVRWAHCCSNIDWSLLTDSKVDVINFDAYEHAPKLALYGAELQGFLERGGSLGWGMVPVREELIQAEDADSLCARMQEGFDMLVEAGVDSALLASSSWVLTSCETSLLSEKQAERAFGLVGEVSKRMRAEFGL